MTLCQNYHWVGEGKVTKIKLFFHKERIKGFSFEFEKNVFLFVDSFGVLRAVTCAYTNWVTAFEEKETQKVVLCKCI